VAPISLRAAIIALLGQTAEVDVPVGKKYTKGGKLHGGFVFVRLSTVEAREQCLQLVSGAKSNGDIFWTNAEAKSCTSKVSVSRQPEKSSQRILEAMPAPTSLVSELPLKRKREEHYGAKKRQKKLFAKLLTCEGVMDRACGGENVSLDRLPFVDLLKLMRPGTKLASASNSIVHTAPDWTTVPAEIDPSFDMKLAGRGGSKKRARRAEAEVSRAQRKKWQIESFLHILRTMDIPGIALF
jgi:hypothetical protein